VTLRLIVAGAICIALGAGSILLERHASQAVQSARQFLGERWYVLELGERQVGYLHTGAHQDRHGRWLFRSELRFALQPDEAVTVKDEMTFAALAPHPLVQATHRISEPGSTQSVIITREADVYSAIVSSSEQDTRPRKGRRDGVRDSAGRGAGSDERTTALDWSYELGDYLAFETWLRTASPPEGSVMTVPTLNFSRLALFSKAYRITEQNPTGYRVSSPDPLDETIIQLDDAHLPVTLEMAGLFKLRRSSRDLAVAGRGPLTAASYYVPADQRLPNHTRIARIVLGVHGTSDARRLWPQAEGRSGNWTLTLNANPVSSDTDPSEHTATTLEFPATDERIVKLARNAVAGASEPAERVAALTRFVHHYLTYAPGGASRPVMALLDDPVGDCTEHADLFTTLARSLNIPARTVFGLAYADGNEPAFAFHAWNEVSVHEAWRPVDPTWNLLRVDATHIPLPSNRGAALALITGATTNLRFSVLEVSYFDD
jgi:transglutaminase-like putative cysteine protease